MNLKDAVKEYDKGGFKGIARRSWGSAAWVKLNGYGVLDDIHYVYGDSHGIRGYTPNIVDFCADDWEPIE